ncbi:MltA domain-containing protein [Jannaschia sp. S6380]|uniref:murein transglycosylase A n=1 Tax=Jannaschia sp. S6380 TaxID=2926408 RepID=UPI001FF41F7A|nr:MltA domain-containing protein [Jannaschia sp. S6380]MCK0168433.1 MltA domain-containing protein [Jannaschia sp. S6380]
MPGPADTPAAPRTGRPSLSALPGWDRDDLNAALAAFRQNPDDPLGPAAHAATDARSFFARHFAPGPTLRGRFTGYYEPEIAGSRVRSAAFPVPVHACPAGGISLPRAEIEPALAGQEIVWLQDEVDRFFLQVQGSGRIRLKCGDTLRLGYAGGNGHAYRSIGKLLIARGVFGADLSADRLKAWLRADADRGRAVMHENPSYVMFRVVDLPKGSGPQGSLCPVTVGRSIAVDPTQTPLGTPVWIEVDGMARLVVAQDTGSAITGAGRADIFFGTGEAAGVAAGRMNHEGRFTPLIRR